MAIRRALLGITLLLNAVLLYSLIWGEKGAIAYREHKEQRRAIERRIEELQHANLELSKEIHLLKTDEKYVEKMIRTRLNFVRANEILYVFPEKGQGASHGVQSNETED